MSLNCFPCQSSCHSSISSKKKVSRLTPASPSYLLSEGMSIPTQNFPILDPLAARLKYVSTSKIIFILLSFFTRKNLCSKNTGSTNSPVAVSSFIYICKTLHNSVNALTNEDQKRDIRYSNCFVVLLSKMRFLVNLLLLL